MKTNKSKRDFIKKMGLGLTDSFFLMYLISEKLNQIIDQKL